MCDECSMLNWYPLVRDLDIPQPRTAFVLIPQANLAKLYAEEYDFSGMEEGIEAAAIDIGYPLFLRTDHASGKHGWEQTCYVHTSTDLPSHLTGVIEANLLADIIGLAFSALVFRQFIPMASRFLAFHGRMPIGPERRYFIDGGKVICHHPYWPEDAIRPCPETPSIWKELLREMNHESSEEVSLLSGYCERIGNVMRGFWSVDFCKGLNGEWWLIDMANGRCSWHPETCLERAKRKTNELPKNP